MILFPMEKLTVTNLFNFQQPTPLLKTSELNGSFLTDNYLILTTPKKILRYQVKQFKFFDSFDIETLISSQKLSRENLANGTSKILSICEQNNIIFVIFQNNPEILVINTSQKTDMQIYWLSGHMDSVTSILAISGTLFSGSQDYTIRLWDIEANCSRRNQINQNQKKKLKRKPEDSIYVLTGHKSQINCLERYGRMFVSGSEDRNIIFWHNTKRICSQLFETPVLNLQSCEKSSQLLVCEKNNTISIISMSGISSATYHGSQIYTPQIVKVIPSEVNTIISIRELDQSFVVFSDGQSLTFFEINLGKIIRKIECDSIVSVESLGKVLILGRHYTGIQLLKL